MTVTRICTSCETLPRANPPSTTSVSSKIYLIIWLVLICFRSGQCPAKICLVDDKIISRSGVHNHGPMKSLLEVELVEAAKLAEALASVNTSSTRSFVSSIASSLDTPEKIAMISSNKALQMRFERGRKKLQKFPPIPRTFPDMSSTYPDSLRGTKSNSVFLRHEGCIVGSNYENSWLFVSDVGVDQLIRSSVWVMDGTFASAPHPFRQIFCINIISSSGTDLFFLMFQFNFHFHQEGLSLLCGPFSATRPRSCTGMAYSKCWWTSCPTGLEGRLLRTRPSLLILREGSLVLPKRSLKMFRSMDVFSISDR